MSSEHLDDQVDQTIRVRSLFEQDHEDQADGQSVGDIRQEVNGLIKLAQLFDRGQHHRQKKGQSGRDGDGDDNDQKGVFNGLQKIRIMQHIGIVVPADSEIALRSGVIALLEGINENIDQRVYHKHAQEDQGGQQIQPRFPIIRFFHEIRPFTCFGCRSCRRQYPGTLPFQRARRQLTGLRRGSAFRFLY